MEPTRSEKIPKRILSSLMNSLSAGVVPRMGAPYIAIGRNDEISALLGDLEEINEGGCSMRFVVGKYGSGKSFLLQLVRGYALERGFVTADADLTPERKICGGKGSGVATYRELMKNLASKTSPDGGALPQIISRWLSNLQAECAGQGLAPGSPEFAAGMNARIFALTHELEDQVGGFDFAAVLSAYYAAEGQDGGEAEAKKSACLRWLRGEFNTKTEARAQLPVGNIIDDESWYDYLKLLAVFVRKIGYRGLVVFLDECVNLYKIPNRISRENNYEKLLAMFNDSLQGRSPGLAMVLGGTPQFLEDTRRGLFSYEALRSRLCDGQFASAEFKNTAGPVIRLRRLSDDELFALIARVTGLYSQYHGWEAPVTTADMTAFLQYCLSRAGADTMITPREILRDYITVLNILRQNPEVDFARVMGSGAVSLAHQDADAGESPPPAENEESPRPDYTLDDIDI